MNSSETCVLACPVASVVSDSLRSYGLKAARLLCPWNFPGKNAGCHALLPGIFPTQGLNRCLLRLLRLLCLLHCRWVPYPLSHLGSLRFLISIRLTENWGIPVAGRMWGHGTPHMLSVGVRTTVAFLEGSSWSNYVNTALYHVTSNSAPKQVLTKATREG